MINNLRKKIFWTVVIVPLVIVFLVLTIYNYSYVSYVLYDETKTINYCVKSLKNNSDEFDEYMSIPLEELSGSAKFRYEANPKLANLVYSIVSSEIFVVKLSPEGEILAHTGLADDDSSIPEIVAAASGQTVTSGKLRRMIYRSITVDECRYMVFLNTANWHFEIKVILFSSFGALVVTFLLLALMARYLSRKITRPIQEAMEKQNRFIADASHELKTPVSVINANISVLEREYGESKWMKYIKDEGNRMTKLVNELLSLCRMDFEARDTSCAPVASTFDASEVIMETSLPFDSVAFEKGIALSTECGQPHICKGSGEDFKKILSVLIDNAIGHTEKGGQITITATPSSGTFFFARDTKLRVDVRNTGSVISSEDLPRIFDRFYKSRASRGNHYNFGLGLSIAKALADKNGFRISAGSDSCSTTFVLVMDM